jgi:pyridoxine kinase
MSGFGRCALTVVIPTLAAMGIQPVPLPTALLSTHTGGFTGFTFLDLTSEMENISSHWKNLGVTFDAVYSGFLGSGAQCGVVSDFIGKFRSAGTLVLVDPVMGDNGTLYATVTPEITSGMLKLVSSADIITPNVTEANILLGIENSGGELCHTLTEAEVADRLIKLSALGPAEVVITGIRMGGDIVTAGLKKGGSPFFCAKQRIDASYPGTGDLFASVLLGRRLEGDTLAEASAAASGFVYDVICGSVDSGQPRRDGVLLEKFLYRLIKKV